MMLKRPAPVFLPAGGGGLDEFGWEVAGLGQKEVADLGHVRSGRDVESGTPLRPA